ncbi:MAG: rhodanese-like domain-containing protein [Wenzhouxiangella sp.]|nr:MAG: rhodanese-like domain-containing protein [Wenzhouxiangella sp.]
MSSKLVRIAAACGITAAVAVLATGCTPSEGPSSADLERVGSSIARGEAIVTVPALSRRIVEDQGDFRLVDLRPVIAFEDGHIPGAMSVGVTEIVKADRAREVAGNRQLVLYSGDGIAASQASALLQLQGINAVALQGGFDAWFAYTSDPAHELPGQEPMLGSEERRQLAQFFHGDDATATAAPSGRDRAAALGLTPATPSAPAAAPQVDDPHGLGLQYGLGVGIEFELAAAEDAPAAEEEPAPRRRLLIGEGC